MLATIDMTVNKVEHSKLKDINLENLPFGKFFTDHMLEADYENGEWKNAEIKPYQPLLLSPSLAALHYGQSIFEGIKAYKNADGEAFIFRPYDNFKRFNISAERMAMPQVPEDIFMEGMKQLVALDKAWIPQIADHSLYIRPFMFSADEVIGVRPSETYKFLNIVQEAGTMNVFFIIGDKAITPDLNAGTILGGVTRDSTITLLKEAGFTVEERPLSIDEIIDAYKSGLLYEVFGTGTAATITMIRELRYKDFVMNFDTDKWQTAPTIKKWLTDIREGRREDKYGWMVKV